MEKTIREDRERKILREVLINDNTLLQAIEESDEVIITVRYIDGLTSSIRESIILRVKRKTYVEQSENLFKINEDRNTIAIYQKEEDNYVLKDVYDAECHEFVPYDFRDILFKERFPQKKLNKKLSIEENK